MLCTSQDVISLDNNPCDTGCLTSNPFFFFAAMYNNRKTDTVHAEHFTVCAVRITVSQYY